ncbi:MAG: SGNH/GDSL hydrolase family protein [Planctomycetes bacterium]|nr:SGNH/GDSL hydrolase family protein [Planctomycetota bacterium]
MIEGRAPLYLKLAVAAVATLLATAVAGWLYWRNYGGTIVLRSGDGTEQIWNGQVGFAVDPEVGFKTARSVSVRFRMGPLGGDAEALVRSSNNHGFIAEEDYGEVIPPPRVVVLGDSHTMGVVATADNIGPVLQRALRAQPGLERATVMNAGTGPYSLYQYLLRARQLLPHYRPQALVVVVFLGNDFLNLEDTARPHLDDALRELPAVAEPPPETTTARMRELALPGAAREAFWQGLDQALYLGKHPERREPILQKAEYVVQGLSQLASEHDCQLVVVALPSFDLVFPERASLASARAAEVVQSATQNRMHDDFLALLRRRGIDHVDLLPVFQRDGRLELYAGDFHIWKPGHRAIADAVLPRLRSLLSR